MGDCGSRSWEHSRNCPVERNRGGWRIYGDFMGLERSGGRWPGRREDPVRWRSWQADGGTVEVGRSDASRGTVGPGRGVPERTGGAKLRSSLNAGSVDVGSRGWCDRLHEVSQPGGFASHGSIRTSGVRTSRPAPHRGQSMRSMPKSAERRSHHGARFLGSA
jgi:hypothetical protein